MEVEGGLHQPIAEGKGFLMRWGPVVWEGSS